MSKKLKRSAVALVLAATMVFSSQGVLTAFAVGENETSTAVDVSALGPILDKEETVVVEGPGNTDETETPEVTESCDKTEGCTLSKGHNGECVTEPVTPPEEENGEGEKQPCTKTEGCTLENGHEGECVTEPVTPPEEENGEDETQPCQKTEGCILPNGHEDECVVEENTEDTEDTQEPSEEDVAAAKNVSDLIGALPEASTLAPETTDVEALTAQVKAAREAYDKLTDAQKALVEQAVLDKLVALEGALEGLQQANTIPGDDVAQIDNETYATLDAAVEAAEEGSTITLLKDCELTKGFNKTLTFTGGHKITINKQLTSNGEGWMCFGLYDPSRVLTFDGVDVEWNSEVGTAPWLMLSLSGTMNVTKGAHVKFTVDSGSTGSRNAIYLNAGSSINVSNGSTFEIYGYGTAGKEGQGLQLDKAGAAGVNVTGKSTFLIDGTNRGYVNSPTINVEDSKFTVQNCTANASNGGKFTATKGSTITYQNNNGHGLSAGNVTIKNSTVDCNNNAYYGLTYSGDMTMDSTSKINANGNGYGYTGGGLRAYGTSTVEAGAVINILNNKRNGMEQYGDFVFKEGSEITVTGNNEPSTNGGGIFNNGTLTLPSNATITNNSAAQTGGGICNAGTVTIPAGVQLYNNHAGDAGDDIYNRENATITFGKVGSDWKLDGAPDCNHAITGWFDDSKDNRWNVHTGPVHAELYNEFDETTGLTTITGLKALKAAHPYQYDPDAPTEPSEPVDWETSKSKTATNLDKNYESQVTLSLPAKDEQLVSDVVFVLDKSTSTDVREQALAMLNDLQTQVANTNAKVKVGVVVFNRVAHRVLEPLELTEENISLIEEAFAYEVSGGTNMNAGLLAGKAMLDEDDSVAANRKYMILISDGFSYYYSKDNDYSTAYTISLLNGGNDGHGGGNCTPCNKLECYETKYGSHPSDYEALPYNGNWDTWYSNIQTLIEQDADDGWKYEYEYGNEPSASDDPNSIPYTDRMNHVINVDVSLYNSYNIYHEMLNKGYHCYSLSGDISTSYKFGPLFMEYMGGDTYLGTDDTAFDNIQNDIFYLLDAGSSVIDVIGGDDNGEQYDYDFDFVNDIEKITLTVGDGENVRTLHPTVDENDPNHLLFGNQITEGDYAGHYEYELTYYPNGLGVATMAFENEDVVAGELFRWDIYVPVKQFEPVQLTYTVKLANPKTTEGNYGQYDEDGSENYAGLYTNNSAVLFPVDSNGNVGEKEAFDKPTVSYTVGGNDNPGTDSTPDPDPDPDRPSRPNRDDDDDWEPLPDAPVKDKPTTEVDVPEETETPTTEQPDKYNPETGDTTTVFAAMALAAVSLGGVVLLGRKKK